MVYFLATYTFGYGYGVGNPPCYSRKTFRNCISPFANLSDKKIFVLIMIIIKTSKFGNNKYYYIVTR